MVSDEELDEFVKKNEQEKEEYANATLNEDVERQMNEMSFYWKVIHDKLETDNVCFVCGKQIIDKENGKQEPMRVVVPGQVDKGVVAFCSVCKECYEKLLKEEQEKQKEKESEGDKNE